MIFSKEYRKHYIENLVLATPVIIGQVGHMAASVVDSIMVGQLGSVNLAASSLANTVFLLFMLFGLGVSTGSTALVGEANGDKNTTKCRALFNHSFFMHTTMGLILGAMVLLSAPWLYHLDQPVDVVDLTIPYYNVLGLSMLPLMLFSNFKQFLEGLTLTRAAMISSILGNSLNVLLNYLFIFGKWGFEPMGLLGAGWATFYSRIAMALFLGLHIAMNVGLKQYFHQFAFLPKAWNTLRDLWKIGLPVGVQFVFEIGAFSLGAILIGTLGAEQMAAHQIAIRTIAVIYMGAVGISTGATIRISNFFGEKKYRDMRLAGTSSFVMVLFFMSGSSLFISLFNDFLPSIYTNEIKVIEMASSLFVIAAFFQLVDGIQVVALGALRGLQDVKMPTAIALVSYWIIALPLCYLFAIPLGMGARGVWFGFLAGLASAAILLYFRYERTIKRIQKQIAEKQA